MDAAEWDRALKQAMRAPYVVQERVEPVRSVFPAAEFRSTGISRDAGGRASARLSRQSAGLLQLALFRSNGFSSAAGIVPTFIVDSKA